MNVEIIPVWKQMTPELSEELKGFWRDNKAIADESTAAARVSQAVCIVRDEAGTLCGVSTAIVRILPRLRQPMYYFRQFFAKSLRGKNQFIPVYRRTRQILQAYNESLDRAESLGLLIEKENAKLNTAYPHAYEPAFAAAFIGYSPRGKPMFVSYFDGAILQPPSPIRAAALATPNGTAKVARQPSTPRRTAGRS